MLPRPFFGLVRGLLKACIKHFFADGKSISSIFELSLASLYLGQSASDALQIDCLLLFLPAIALLFTYSLHGFVFGSRSRRLFLLGAIEQPVQHMLRHAILIQKMHCELVLALK